MEDKNNYNKDLFLPPMIPDNNDFMSGIGSKELSILAAGFGITIVGVIACFILTGNMMIAIVVPFSAFAGLFVCIRRDQYEESLVDKLRFLFKYRKAQKRFEYVYYDELENLLKELDTNQENGK